MLKTEKILIAITLIALVMRFSGVADSSFLLITGMSTLALFYYLAPLLFNGIRLSNTFKRGSLEKVPIAAFIAAFFVGGGLAAALLGILFKLQFWPGARNMLFAGIGVTVLSSLAAYFISRKHGIGLWHRASARILPFTAFGLLLLSVSSETLADLTYSDPEKAELLKQVLRDPDNEALRDAFYNYGSERENKGQD